MGGRPYETGVIAVGVPGAEHRAICVAVSHSGPVSGPDRRGIGRAGRWAGVDRARRCGSPELDSQFRYLSGLLLAIGLGYLASVPRIEEHSRRILLLTGLVVTGGIGRLIAALARGQSSMVTGAALAMELVIVPAIALWQFRVARQGTSCAKTAASFRRNYVQRQVEL